MHYIFQYHCLHDWFEIWKVASLRYIFDNQFKLYACSSYFCWSYSIFRLKILERGENIEWMKFVCVEDCLFAVFSITLNSSSLPVVPLSRSGQQAVLLLKPKILSLNFPISSYQYEIENYVLVLAMDECTKHIQYEVTWWVLFVILCISLWG